MTCDDSRAEIPDVLLLQEVGLCWILVSGPRRMAITCEMLSITKRLPRIERYRLGWNFGDHSFFLSDSAQAAWCEIPALPASS